MEQPQEPQTMSDEEAILKIVAGMKDNAPVQEEKHSVPTFLFNVVQAEVNKKLGNLRVDKDVDELGTPIYNVRGALEMKRISDKIMENAYFSEYFDSHAEDTLRTSLSREGFLIKQATTQTKQVADVTRRRKTNKGWFGKQTTEETGGDTNQPR